jgi:hypothetical protein
MNSVKAIISGTLFIIIGSMLIQLVYIFIAVGYNALAKDYPFLNEISIYFRYLLGIPVFIFIMYLGGYLSALIAQKKVLLHSAIVAVIAIAAMMWPLLANANMTLTGIIVSMLSFLATLAGAWSWQRRNTHKTA